MWLLFVLASSCEHSFKVIPYSYIQFSCFSRKLTDRENFIRKNNGHAHHMWEFLVNAKFISKLSNMFKTLGYKVVRISFIKVDMYNWINIELCIYVVIVLYNAHVSHYDQSPLSLACLRLRDLIIIDNSYHYYLNKNNTHVHSTYIHT